MALRVLDKTKINVEVDYNPAIDVHYCRINLDGFFWAFSISSRHLMDPTYLGEIFKDALIRMLLNSSLHLVVEDTGDEPEK